MQPINLPGLSGLIPLVIAAFLFIVGLAILILVVKVVLHFFLAIVVAGIVWFFTLDPLLAGIAFVAVAIVTSGKRKKTVVYAPSPPQATQGKICPNCRMVLAQNAQFCPNCGTRL